MLHSRKRRQQSSASWATTRDSWNASRVRRDSVMKSERLDVVLNEQGEATGLVGYAAFEEMKALMAEADVWNGGFTADGKITLIRVEVGWAYWGARHRSPPHLMNSPHATDKHTTDPHTTDTLATDPHATNPHATDPQATEPFATDPQTTNPLATDPLATDPHRKPTCSQMLPGGFTGSGETDAGGNRPWRVNSSEGHSGPLRKEKIREGSKQTETRGPRGPNTHGPRKDCYRLRDSTRRLEAGAKTSNRREEEPGRRQTSQHPQQTRKTWSRGKT